MPYRVYDLEIAFTGRVLGGIPGKEEVLKGHLMRQCQKHFGGDEDKAAEEAKATLENIDEELATHVNVFRRNPDGVLCLAGYQVKAMIREAGSMLGMTKARKGRASFRQTLQHGFFVQPKLMELLSGGTPIRTPDGKQEDTGTIVDKAGARSIITANEYVEEATCAFRVLVVDNGAIKDEEMKELFGLARNIGLGSKRARDAGTFEITSYQVADPVPVDDGF